jgi:hypothetical protein
MLRCVAIVRTEVSHKCSASIIRVRSVYRLMVTDGILHSQFRKGLKSYIELNDWTPYRRRNVSRVKYELWSDIPEDDILHSHSRENLKRYIALTGCTL